MKFLLNKNKIVTGLFGHSVEFKKGELIHVPKEMWDAVTAVGATPESELPDEDIKPKEPELSVAERKELIFTAFTSLVEKNARESFTGNGSPHIRMVSDITGFAVDAKERDAAWAEFRQLNASPDA